MRPSRGHAGRMPVRQAVATLKTTLPIVILANEESSEESKAREGEPVAVEQQTRLASATRKGTTRARVVQELVELQGPKSAGGDAVNASTGAVQPVPMCW